MFVFGYPLTNVAIHIDSETNIANGDLIAFISLGRWGVVLTHILFGIQHTVPYFIQIVSLALICLSALITAFALGLTGGNAVMLALLYVSVPQLAYQLEFMNQCESVMLGLFCASVASCLIIKRVRGNSRQTFASIALSVVLLAFAIGCYQSLLFIPATICCLYCANSLLEDAKTSNVLGEAAIMLVVMIAAYAVCQTIAKIVQLQSGVPPAAYFDKMVHWGTAPAQQIVRDLLVRLFQDVTQGEYYGDELYKTIWLPVGAGIVVALRHTDGLIRKALFVAFALALPLMPFFVELVVGGALPARVSVAQAAAFAGAWALVLSRLRACEAIELAKEQPLISWSFFTSSDGLRAFFQTLSGRRLATIVVAVSLLFGAFRTSRLFAADTAALAADRLLGNRVVTVLYTNYPDFDATRTPVYFAGAYASPNLWRPPSSDVFGSSVFAWDGGNPVRIVAFLKVVGIANLTMASREEEARVKDQVADLPVWPNPYSVHQIDGVMVVRLGR